MKFRKALVPGIFSILLLALFVIYRKDNALQILAAFFALMWFVQVPGSLLLILSENSTKNFLRIILFGHVIGLALVPLLYYSLFYMGLHDFFFAVISILNILLGLFVVIRLKGNKIQFPEFDPVRFTTITWLLAVVMVVCSIREFSQMLNWHYVFNSKHDTDAGILMSMVVGIKKYGYLVNMNFGSVPVSYHHFIYLLMALVMKSAHIGILPLYQVVFPLYTFFYMTLAAYYLMKSFNVSEKLAFLSAVSLLFLDDFYLLNQGLKVLFHHQPLFTIESIEWLHNSPSTAISLMMMFVVLAELAQAEMEKMKSVVMILLVVSTGTLACYKISTWACLVGGMLAASLFTYKKSPRLALVALFSVFAGFIVNKFLSGVGKTIYSSDGMDLNFAYPLLRSESLKKFLHLSHDIFSFHDFSFKVVSILAVVTLYYLAGVFGIRLLYVFKKTKEGIGKINFTSATILFAVLGGIAISFMVTPKVGQHNSLYFILTGMYVLSVVSVPLVAEVLENAKSVLLKSTVVIILFIQLGSGLLQVLQPFTNPVKGSSLSTAWFEAMNYAKENTPENSLLAYNRFRLKEDYYKDDFDFIPVYAERPVVVGGKQYFADYEMKKSKLDTLFSSASVDDVKRISGELKINYILFDKWNGKELACHDSVILQPVFSNQQVDIYKVRQN